MSSLIPIITRPISAFVTIDSINCEVKFNSERVFGKQSEAAWLPAPRRDLFKFIMSLEEFILVGLLYPLPLTLRAIGRWSMVGPLGVDFPKDSSVKSGRRLVIPPFGELLRVIAPELNAEVV